MVKDWQAAASLSRLASTADGLPDDCFIGGVKEDTPNDWAFNTDAGGCTPGKSNLLGMWVHAELTTSATFLHVPLGTPVRITF